MWDKIFIGSLVAFVIGIAIFLLADYVVQYPSQVVLFLGRWFYSWALVAIGGLVTGVAGIALILTTDTRANT